MLLCLAKSPQMERGSCGAQSSLLSGMQAANTVTNELSDFGFELSSVDEFVGAGLVTLQVRLLFFLQDLAGYFGMKGVRVWQLDAVRRRCLQVASQPYSHYLGDVSLEVSVRRVPVLRHVFQGGAARCVPEVHGKEIGRRAGRRWAALLPLRFPILLLLTVWHGSARWCGKVVVDFSFRHFRQDCHVSCIVRKSQLHRQRALLHLLKQVAG